MSIKENNKNYRSAKQGSVLVIGAGISGIQSSLDLADAGFKVYLLEEKSAIGGVMSQLDKTFPTNDCSMCIMSPKLVDVGRHSNIELITYSELKKVTGKAGNFKIKILKKPRYVDGEKCTGCGLCVENCPVLFLPQIPKKTKEIPQVRDQKYIDKIIGKYSPGEGSLIQIIIEVNDKYGYLPRDVINYLSFKLDISVSNIYRVATFYKAFNLEPRGKYYIKVCNGTACHIRGASKIVEKISSIISNTEEGLFSLETVNCIGACAIGPVMVVNDEVYGKMTVEKAGEILISLEGK